MTDDAEHDGRDPDTGRFVAGNRFWTARSSHGRNPIFETPDDLWQAVSEYFDWVDANPLYEEKVFNGKDGIARATIAKMRAMTISGLCIFLDIDRKTWEAYRGRSDFSPITTRAEEIIRDQKFSGAAADLLNASIIARDLGLAEKNEHSGPNGGAIVHRDESKTEAELVEQARRLGIDPAAIGLNPGAAGGDRSSQEED